MSERPIGTVTFLFTDIEGSTKLWEQHPEAMKLALAHHDALLQQAIESHGGYVFKTIGDAFCAAFATAPDALAAALAAQRSLAADPSDPTASLRVRAVLHTGTAEEREGDYVGPVVNRATRLASVGHGGQVLLSQPTYELVRDTLPEGVSFRDLGEHRLKDLSRPQHIYQVLTSDLPSDFPPLKTLDARPNNLPMQPTLLVGREREVAAVLALLQRPSVRLVTLIGPGGIGKTRLALQIGADLLDLFTDGVYAVDLASITDPALLVPTIAQTLSVREQDARPLLDTLKDYLSPKRLLLILDNFEQVVSAAPIVSDLLTSASKVTVLVTSRIVLHLRGEQEFLVPPLAVPDPQHLPPLEILSQYAAVELFIQRAMNVQPDFAVTNANAPAVAEICQRLDGLPLAIELAAARVRIFSPQVLLQRLGSRLKLLTGGPRDLPARQQTLRNAIAWSYDLLDEQEKALFRRLAVFRGGFTLDAAEAVCGVEDGQSADLQPAPLDILDGVTSLIDKSLLRQDDGERDEPRFAILETLREYGLTQLVDSGELDSLQQRHARFFLALAEEAEPHLCSATQVQWLRRLETENDNLRAVLTWSEAAQRSETGLRVVTALVRFWMRQSLTETRFRLDRLLSVDPPPEPTSVWAEALLSRALLSYDAGDIVAAHAQFETTDAMLARLGDKQALASSLSYHSRVLGMLGDFAAARALAERAVALSGEVGDRWGVAEALHNLGHVDMEQGDFEAPRVHFEQSVELFRTLGDRIALTGPLSDLGQIAYQRGDYREARARFEESLAISRELDDRVRLAYWLLRLGDLARSEGNDEQARACYEDSLTLYQALGSQFGVPMLLHNLGYIAQRQGRYDEAGNLLLRALQMLPAPQRERERAQCLAGLASLWAAEGQPARAALLFAAAQQVLTHNPPATPADQTELERTAATLHGMLGEEEWEALRAQGQAMTLDQAVAYALPAA